MPGEPPPAFAPEIDCFPACPAVAAPVEDIAPAFGLGHACAEEIAADAELQQ